MELDFDLKTVNHKLLNNDVQTDKTANGNLCVSVFTRCGPDELLETERQSCGGHLLYTGTVCLTFLVGYWIYRVQDIQQRTLSSVELYGDLCAVAFLSFAISTMRWHGFEKLTCLSASLPCCNKNSLRKKSRNNFWCGLLRYFLFVVGILGSVSIYGTMRNIPLFQSSLNADLSDDQLLVYGVAFTIMGFIVFYWIFKLFSFESTKACCNPSNQNKIAFVRLLIVLTGITVVSGFVCVADESCDWHLHHWWFGFILVLLSSPLLDNWFDIVIHGVFWMLLLESQWNWIVSIDAFFI